MINKLKQITSGIYLVKVKNHRRGKCYAFSAEATLSSTDTKKHLIYVISETHKTFCPLCGIGNPKYAEERLEYISNKPITGFEKYTVLELLKSGTLDRHDISEYKKYKNTKLILEVK